MNPILTSLQHNFNSHMNHNHNTATKFIGSVYPNNKVILSWWDMKMHYMINGDEPWILCTSKADTPNVNLHRNIQCTDRPMEPDLAAAPTTILEIPEAAVAALIKIPVAGPRAAAATMIIKTPVPVAVGLTPKKNGWQWHQSGGNDGGKKSLGGKQICDCDDHEPQSPHWRTLILNKCSHSSRLNNQEGVMTHPAWHLCLTDNV